MPKDTRYLKRDKKSGIYIFQKRVSDSVAGLLGMKNNIYNKSLGTDSLREAQGLRHSHLAYLKKLEDAESVNPSYQSVMDKYKLMDHGRLEHEFGVLSDELTTTYSHLGNPEWEDLSEQEKNAIGAPVSITEKDDIEYRVLASLTGRDPDFKPPEKSFTASAPDLNEVRKMPYRPLPMNRLSGRILALITVKTNRKTNETATGSRTKHATPNLRCPARLLTFLIRMKWDLSRSRLISSDGSGPISTHLS